MILSGETLNPSDLPVYDICIVGAGAAGFAMIDCLADWALKNQKKIVMLDSGTENIVNPEHPHPTWGDNPRYMDKDKDIRDLDAGAIEKNSFLAKLKEAFPSERDFLTRSRTRCYGGSTNCWGGFIRPLDPFDFREWPIDRTTLEPFYKEALKLVDLGNFDIFDDPLSWRKLVDKSIAIDVPDKDKLAKAGLRTVVIQQQRDVSIIDFQQRFGHYFTDNPTDKYYKTLTLIKNATAVMVNSTIQSNNKWTTSNLECRAVGINNNPRHIFKVSALQIVLAMGGLEIPRFLLNCREKIGAPFPWQDLGKFYMNHPKYENLAKGTVTFADDVFSDATNTFFAGVPLKDQNSVVIQAFIVPTADGITRHQTSNYRIALHSEKLEKGKFLVQLENNFEQIANPASQITLAKDKDVFDQRRLNLDWKFSDKDRDTVNGSIGDLTIIWMQEVLGGKLESDWNKDSVIWKLGEPDPPVKDYAGRPIYTGDHHMGTCRMKPSFGGDNEGVVDGDCKVLYYNNLWICSTGVYPRGGWANATLTLLALSLRLAGTLKKVASAVEVETS